LVTRLSRPHRAGGRVIGRAAILAVGVDSAAVLTWIAGHAWEPEDLAPPATDREAAARPGEAGPTITATLSDGPLEGKSVEAEVVEGRPPKTIDVPADDGSPCRYCLAGWVQHGSSAVYTFLYRVETRDEGS
jgi:hypothetical protein